jgi:RHS repeat-associated protein
MKNSLNASTSVVADRCLKVVLPLVFLASFAFGQETTGSPAGAFGVTGGDVDPATLAVTVKVPILSKPGAIPLSAADILRSSCYQQGAYTACLTPGITTSKQDTPGLHLTPTMGLLGANITVINQHPCAPPGPLVAVNLAIVLADGSIHPINGTASQCVPNTVTGTANDGSGLTLSATVQSTLPSDLITGTITATDGENVGYTYSIANGPMLTGGNQTSWDTFGNQVQVNIGATEDYADTLTRGYPNPTLSYASGTGAWQWLDTTGAPRTRTLTKGTNGNFGFPVACGYLGQPGWNQPSSFTYGYPDNSTIIIRMEQIGANYTGRIGSVTLRTGGTISYSYGSLLCLNGTTETYPSSLTKTTPDGPTTYTLSITGSSPPYSINDTVVDPGKNKTVYYFTGYGAPYYSNGGWGGPNNYAPVLTEVQHYQNTGSVQSPVYVLLSTQIYCYNTNATNCATKTNTYPITQRDTYKYVGSSSLAMSHTTQTFDAYGNILTNVATDSITGQTVYTGYGYGTLSGGNCVALGNTNIKNHPCTIDTHVTNGSGALLSQTWFTYNSNGAITSNGVWTGSGASHTGLVTNYTPNANGTTASVQAPNGQITNIGYDGSCNGLVPTSSSTTVYGVVLQASQTWDCNGGVVLTTTDVNGHTPPATQYDSMFRPTSVSDALGFTLNKSYTSNTSTTSWSMTSPPASSATITTVDGLGRFANSQTTHGSNYDTVSTIYRFQTQPGDPRFYVQTNEPCTATLGSTCSSPLYQHYNFLDPLGRSLSRSTNNHEVYNSTYSQNDVQVQLVPPPPGENPKTVQTEYDGLGRVKSICSLLSSGGTSCGQAMGGSGILTSFTYSFGAGSSTVTATRGSQSHTVVYDALGRVTLTRTPEAGTTQFIYDTGTTVCSSPTPYSNPGYLMETIDNAGVHVCYLRDGLGRVYTTYSPGTSAGPWHNCRILNYTEYNPGGAPTGWSSANGIGQIAEATVDYNCNGSVYSPTEWFMYDKDGRMTDEWESTANSGGYYHTTVNYYQNGEFHWLNGIPAYGTFTTNLDSNGVPNSTIDNSGTPFIVSLTRDAAGRATTINFGNNNVDSYTFDPYTGNMTNYTFNIFGKTMSGTLTWNPNGSLKSLAIVDGFNSRGTQTCNYLYDDVGRLGVPPNSPTPPAASPLSVDCGSTQWQQAFGYDQYDNLTQAGSGSWSPGYNSSNNEMIGSLYDADGKVIYDGVNTYTWNQYGQIVGLNAGSTAAVCGTSGTCITYDALGRSVEINSAGAVQELLYSPAGRVARMNGQTTLSAFVPQLAGVMLYEAGNPCCNLEGATHPDWLGNARLGTSSNTFDTAYAPYGQRYDSFGPVIPDYTGDLQDIFAGLYDTPNRELMSNAGRWLSPDPAHASWNAYAYPTDPNTQTDPSGLDGQDPQTQTPQVSADLVFSFDANNLIAGLLGEIESLNESIANGISSSGDAVAMWGAVDAGPIAAGIGTVSSEPTFAGGFWGPNGVTGSDAAWKLVNATFSAPNAALAHHTCGDGVLCQVGVSFATGIAIGGVQGIASAGNALPSILEEGGISALRAGQLAEGPALDAIGSAGKVRFTPTAEQVDSAAFKVIVGDARYTASGAPVGTIFDGSTAAGLAEIKSGSSVLSSSYQLRLQTFGALVNNQPLTIFTSRPINSTFYNWLIRWGVSVTPLP